MLQTSLDLAGFTDSAGQLGFATSVLGKYSSPDLYPTIHFPQIERIISTFHCEP